MGIVAFCPQGHRVKVKDQLAGRKGICPECGARFRIPESSQLPPADQPAAPTAAGAGERSSGGLPSARFVSLDGDLAATLPRVLPLATPSAGGSDD